MHKLLVFGILAKNINYNLEFGISAFEFRIWTAGIIGVKDFESLRLKKFTDSNKRTFLFKLIHDELSTLDRLAIRQPKVYSSFTLCPLCYLTEENIEHLFLCSQTKNQRSQLWNNSIFYIISSLQKSLENNYKHLLVEDDLHTTITSVANNISSLIKFTSGFIQPNYVSIIKHLTAEKQYGITNQMKRKQTYITHVKNKEFNNNSINNNNNINNISNSNNNNDNNSDNNNSSNNISNNVNNSFNLIKRWVSKGIKFLNFSW
ncbi:hypothetical protein Glove_165g173 [Diversispora epigaea]|uniref:Uncharacterized protein n=1 Tax=Diversispora epigaea TaxID=1348612 RepID=A0A397IQW0_9GLOM|nr:hypothetical protein Glove_165g173 [Diversispora epigaea]